MNTEIIKESVKTLKSSTEELSAAVEHMSSVLSIWGKRLDQVEYLKKEEKTLVYHNYKVLNTEVTAIQKKLHIFVEHLKATTTTDQLETLIEEKKLLYSLFRICLSQFATLLTCLNWQSPSIKSSQDTRIGIEKAAIEADWNDYKRDRSGDTFACEEMIEQNLLITKNTGYKPVTNVFNSGMAAFTAIIYFLITENIVKKKVLASSQIYVENKLLLKSFFKNSLDIFTENDTETIIKHIEAAQPDVLFVEPLTNTNNLRLFDVVEIVKAISKTYKKDLYLILDVTCIVGFENIFEDYKLPNNIKIILHGSILKSPQLGLERINAGFVQTYGLEKLSEKILDNRTMSGTNIQDYATNLLPFTTKKHLQERMKTIATNALSLARFVSEFDPQTKIISEIIYPGLESHPDFKLAKKLGFTGSFFNIKFISDINNDKYFEFLTTEIINSAKKHACDIVHGASFGFNHTSVYYSVGWDEPENHYLRISTGTETTYEIEKIKTVFKEAFSNFKDKYIINH